MLHETTRTTAESTAGPRPMSTPSDVDATDLSPASRTAPERSAPAPGPVPVPGGIDEDELLALLRLTLTTGLGPVRIRRLLEHFHSPRAVLVASPAALAEVEGIGRDSAARMVREWPTLAVEEEREKARAANVALVPITSRAYPQLLRLTPDAPPVLYVQGCISAADVYAVAMVGSRNCTAYGRDIAARLAAGLAQMGLLIVSGGARGIDTAAHQGAVQVQGRTIAVLGSGLAHPYPRENQPLFDRIIESGGAIVSEFPMDMRPAAENFPRRNRIISGLALGTLVVEAPTRSGALITARLANEEHNRVVMALPGKADSAASEGCHDLIRDGAVLVTNTRQILAALDGASHLVTAARAASESPLVRSGTAPLFEAAAAGGGAAEPAAGVGSGGAMTGVDAPGGGTPSLGLLDALRQRGEHSRRAEGDANAAEGGGAATVGKAGDAEATVSPRLANLSPSQQRILAVLEGSEAVEVGELAMLTGLAISQLQADLTMLQIRGVIARVAAGSVRREA